MTVSIIDTNDKWPRLTPPTQRAPVPEDAPVSKVFYTLKATDPDVESPEDLKYEIIEPITAVDKDGKPIDDTRDPAYKVAT